MLEIVSPEKTFAIVVGIEKYRGIQDLDGPANDALRFLEWLRKLRVPPENIITHITPIASNESDCNHRLARTEVPDKNQRGASCTEIRQSLLEGPNQLDGDLLFFFWGGHGMYSYKEKQQLLFGAESRKGDYVGMGADEILDFLQQKQYGAGHYRRRITIIDACADEHHTNNLETRFPLQDSQYQRGTSISDIRFASIQSVALGQRAEQENIGMRRTGVFSNTLLEWLRQEKNWRLPPDLTDITTFELKSFYEAALSDDTRDHPAEDKDHMLATLSEKLPREGIKVNREVEFVWRIATGKQIATLCDWVKKQVLPQALADLKELLRRESLQSQERINYLLVDIPAGPLAKEKKITYWFFTDNPVPERGQIEYPETFEEVQLTILKLVSEKGNYPQGRLFVELYLPFEWLNHGVEEWECLLLSGDAPFLGETYPVVVRWRERAQCAEFRTNYGIWINRAAKIRDKNLCPHTKTHWFDSRDAKPREIMTWLLNNNYGAFVSFIFAPPRESIQGILVGGTPFAFWRRSDFTNGQGWENFKTRFEAMAICGQIDDLPHSIRQLRDESRREKEHHGTSLTLLWDDPNRNPLGDMFRNDQLARSS